MWIREVVNSCSGFYITNSNSNFLYASWCRTQAESNIEADALALFAALNCMHDLRTQVRHIFMASVLFFFFEEPLNRETIY